MCSSLPQSTFSHKVMPNTCPSYSSPDTFESEKAQSNTIDHGNIIKTSLRLDHISMPNTTHRCLEYQRQNNNLFDTFVQDTYCGFIDEEHPLVQLYQETCTEEEQNELSQLSSDSSSLPESVSTSSSLNSKTHHTTKMKQYSIKKYVTSITSISSYKSRTDTHSKENLHST